MDESKSAAIQICFYNIFFKKTLEDLVKFIVAKDITETFIWF